MAGQGFGWPDNLHLDGVADLSASSVEGAGPYHVAGPLSVDHGRVDAPAPELRGRENLLSRERTLFCSAFVQHLFRKISFDLAPGVDDKHTTPEDISRTVTPHVTYRLERETTPGKLEGLKTRFRRRVRARVRQIKRRVS